MTDTGPTIGDIRGSAKEINDLYDKAWDPEVEFTPKEALAETEKILYRLTDKMLASAPVPATRDRTACVEDGCNEKIPSRIRGRCLKHVALALVTDWGKQQVREKGPEIAGRVMLAVQGWLNKTLPPDEEDGGEKGKD